MTPLNGSNNTDEKRNEFDQLGQPGPEELHSWLSRNARREEFLVRLKQPMTVKQMAAKMKVHIDVASELVRQLSKVGLIRCLNGQARSGRVYWVTKVGKECQKTLRKEKGLLEINYAFPNMDWDIYGSVCFAHRKSVIQAMGEPLQAAKIRRIAVHRNVDLRMSANNVRDVMKHLVRNGIARLVLVRKKRHPRYELTELGKAIQALLNNADGFD